MLPEYVCMSVTSCRISSPSYHQRVYVGPSLFVETVYTFPLAEKVEASLADPPAAPVAPASTAAPAAAADPTKVKAKEQPGESDQNMGFGLLG